MHSGDLGDLLLSGKARKKHWSPQQPSPHLTQHRHKVATSVTDTCTHNANHNIHTEKVEKRYEYATDLMTQECPNKTKIHV